MVGAARFELATYCSQSSIIKAIQVVLVPILVALALFRMYRDTVDRRELPGARNKGCHDERPPQENAERQAVADLLLPVHGG